MNSALEEMYQEIILQEARNSYGRVANVDDTTASHQYNPTCGDNIVLAVRIGAGAGAGAGAQAGGAQNSESASDDSVIAQIIWSGVGCSISQSSTSILARSLEGKTIKEAKALASLFKKLMSSKGAGLPDDELDILGDLSAFEGTSRFPGRIKCALLGWMALNGALGNLGIVASADTAAPASADIATPSLVDSERSDGFV
jgi:nitrogen fixation NifU-like protein